MVRLIVKATFVQRTIKILKELGGTASITDVGMKIAELERPCPGMKDSLKLSPHSFQVFESRPSNWMVRLLTVDKKAEVKATFVERATRILKELGGTASLKDVGMKIPELERPRRSMKDSLKLSPQSFQVFESRPSLWMVRLVGNTEQSLAQRRKT